MKVQFKKVLVFFVLTAVIISLGHSSNTLFALADNTKAMPIGLFGYSEETYYDDDDAVYSGRITEMFCSTSYIEIEEVYMAEFLDVIARDCDSNYINISSSVNARFENAGIAEYKKGRIKALSVGTTELVLTYNDFECIVDVVVCNDYNEEYFSQTVPDMNEINSVPGTMYSTVMARANQMKTVSWTTQASFTLNDGSVVPAGTALTGVPYSQLTQCNAIEFLTYYNSGTSNGFYSVHPRGNYYDATYGVDCSGFVSKAWGIPRDTTSGFVSELYSANSSKYEKVGTYTLTSSSSTTGVSSSSLTASYPYLAATCAVVRINSNGGHAMLVLSNSASTNKCSFLEAHNNFPEQVTYTYTQLANMNYCPFSVKTSYFNQYN